MAINHDLSMLFSAGPNQSYGFFTFLNYFSPILILSPMIPLILILIPIPIPIPILILVSFPSTWPVPIPIPVPDSQCPCFPFPSLFPFPSPFLSPFSFSCPWPIPPPPPDSHPPPQSNQPSSTHPYSSFPFSIWPPLPITLIVPGFPTNSSELNSSQLMLPCPSVTIFSSQAYNPPSKYSNWSRALPDASNPPVYSTRTWPKAACAPITIGNVALNPEMDLPEPFFLKDPREETVPVLVIDTFRRPVSCLASLRKTILVELSAGGRHSLTSGILSDNSSQSSTKRPRPSMKGSSSNPKPPSPKAKRPLSKAKVLSSKGTPASSSAKTASNAPASSSPVAPTFASTSRQTLVSVDIHSRISTNPPSKGLHILCPAYSTLIFANLPNPLDITSTKKDRALTSADVLALLDQGRKLSHQLPLNVPEWDQKDNRATCLWDVRHPETIPLSFAGGGEDRDEDWENLDPVLNRVLHVDVPMDVLVKGIRRGSSGTLGIVEGLAFFVEKRSLNPVYFGTKLQCLVEALEVRIKLETTNATSDKIMAWEVTPPSGPGFGLRDGWVKDSGGHRDHDSDESNPGWQSPPSQSQKSQCQTVSFDDSLDDCDEDDDHSDEDGEDGDDTADIQCRRRKFWNDEMDEVVEMFRQFEETKVKPCAQRLGCTVTHLMRIGKWSLNTSECQQRGNPWNAYLNLLKEKDEFVSKSEACNSYAKLKNDMGGSDTEAWVAETECLTSELRGRKTAVGKKKGESGGDVAKLMEQTQRRWNVDGKTLLNTASIPST
ncbi:hypothetical protein BS47DRAFT_1389255 [Hydnum rufescens UP504]|uniref:Uncharacterized protein n=1 Tax=Hydnum rufescens UP504 TaxID=1448309 RepID=A0A9P6B5F3_9AGAM|nr:hypothetical protein BS47DRAFT_1389255 [Hydnum rufescens UP504]